MKSYDPLMELTMIFKNSIDKVKELDNEMTKLKYDNCRTSQNVYSKDAFRYDDNLVAIDMLKDVTKIIEGIERSDIRNIEISLSNLKAHTDEFEKVYAYFLKVGAYE